MDETTPARDQLWSIADLSRYLQIPVESIRKWRARGGGPPAFVVGKHLRFDPAEVAAWLKKQRADAA